ncbi:MAG TPA: hypothetical protein DEW46_07370 [Verrucomicrobia bacterium]|jgi:hypothetical protein|nr:hypothetical protein [Verrucomicrobiota bacterium]
MIALMLILMLWFGWRGYRDGLVRGAISVGLVLIAIPISALFVPLVGRLLPAIGNGPMRESVGRFVAWLVCVSILNILFSLVLNRQRGWRERLDAISKRSWARKGGLLLGLFEALVVCVLIAGVGRIADRLYDWPNRFPGVAEFHQPGWLNGASGLARGGLGRVLADISKPLTRSTDDQLDRVEYLLEIATNGPSLEALVQQNEPLQMLLEDRRVVDLMEDPAILPKLENGAWPEVWMDPRVQTLWWDPDIWDLIQRAVRELRGDGAPPSTTWGR